AFPDGSLSGSEREAALSTRRQGCRRGRRSLSEREPCLFDPGPAGVSRTTPCEPFKPPGARQPAAVVENLAPLERHSREGRASRGSFAGSSPAEGSVSGGPRTAVVSFSGKDWLTSNVSSTKNAVHPLSGGSIFPT